MKKQILVARSLIEMLRENHPASFTPKGMPKVPLKIGIYLDLISLYPEISRSSFKRAMFIWTRKFSYLACRVEGATRVDLDGNPCGVVEKWEPKPEVAPSGRPVLKLRRVA